MGSAIAVVGLVACGIIVTATKNPIAIAVPPDLRDRRYAKGSILGITRGTTAAHIARAALEGIAFQTMDIVTAMEKDSGIRLGELKVDGGASRNNLMMQFQSDILGAKVIRPKVTETTA